MSFLGGDRRIPFTRVDLTGGELRYIRESLKRGDIAGDGEFTARCERFMKQAFHADNILLTNSCTDALEMACLLLELRPGDEVIVPSFTFVSTVNAFVLRGARPVFVDIRDDTLNMDESRIEERITPRTKAIFPVHYAGVACEMDTILALARKHGLAVVEDAAQGVNARYKGRFLGTIGDLGAYSFHATKNFTCGEGGAIVVSNEAMADRAAILREKGTNRRKYLLGLVDKYTWVDVGSSFLMSDILAAFLLSQLEAMESITERRKRIYVRYQEELSGLARAGKLRLPRIPGECVSNYHSFHIVLPSEATRDRVMDALRKNGVQAVFHYIPLHSSDMGLRFGYRDGDLKTTENVSRCLLRLPLFSSLTWGRQQRVIAVLKRCL